RGGGGEERVFGVVGGLGARSGGARARRGPGGPVLPGGGRGRGGRRPRSGLLAPGEGVLGGLGLGVGPPVGTGNRGGAGGVVVPGGRERDGGARRGRGGHGQAPGPGRDEVEGRFRLAVGNDRGLFAVLRAEPAAAAGQRDGADHAADEDETGAEDEARRRPVAERLQFRGARALVRDVVDEQPDDRDAE